MKEAILNYYLESNVAITFSVVLYLLFLRNEQNFQFKRIYLLGVLLLSLVLPFIQLTIQSYAFPAFSYLFQVYTLPEIIITDVQQSSQKIPVAESIPLLNLWQLVISIYFVGASIFLVIFAGRLYKLIHLLKHSPVTACLGKYRIIESEKTAGNFSFLQYVCIGPTDKLSPEEKNQIIAHELAHASFYHSVDILFIELLKIVFWFNPFVHLSKKILTAIHEFQADRQTVQFHNAEQYCQLLAKEALLSANIRLANHFNQSLTLKRIAMIKSVKQKMNTWKLALLFPAITGSLVFVACQDQAMKEVLEKNKTITQVNESQYPPEVQAEIKKLKQKHPDAKFTYIEGELEEVNALFEKYKGSKIPLANFAYKERGTLGILMQDISNNAETMKDAGGIYSVVEDAASPVGGMGELMKFIQTNLTYPAEARAAKIQGKVFVQFVVQEDGSVTDVELLKGIGGGCDEEAIRVVAATKWIPGKQKGVAIKQRMSIPIQFSLGDSTTPNPVGS